MRFHHYLVPASMLVLFCSLLSSCKMTQQSIDPSAQVRRPAQLTHQVQQIALLLPLSNPAYASASAAVRDGFMNAMYLSAGSKPTIKIYNTHEQPLASAYQQAINEGADFIVGPLSKAEVANLNHDVRIQLPTLALNYLPGNSSSASDLYQFGLSPKDESHTAADKASRDGHRRVIVLYPPGPQGVEMAQAFADRFRSQGGQVVDQLAYPLGPKLNPAIQKVLQVNEQFGKTSLIKRKSEEFKAAQSLRRQDIDAIFLIANPRAAQQIVPLLKFNFAGNLPVYATSQIYNGKATRGNKDLEGVMFCDLPAIFNAESPTRSRLAAFGMDAYNLAFKIADNNTTNFQGLTGELSFTQNTIHRNLVWAQFRGGVAVPIG